MGLVDGTDGGGGNGDATTMGNAPGPAVGKGGGDHPRGSINPGTS